MKKIAVIGGGIIGLFSAYYLSKSEHQVTIIDDGPEMAPASAGNCGLITPSHVLPINSWPTIWQGLKWLGKKDAPLAIKPQLNATFLAWFIAFARYSSSSSILKITQSRHELLQLSRSLYEEFFGNEVNQSEWKTSGLLCSCHSEKGMKAMEHEVSVLEKHQLAGRMLTKLELQELEPSINDRTIGGAKFDVDGWLNPAQLLDDLKKINMKNGVENVQAKIDRFTYANGRIKSCHSLNEGIEADEFVLCAGAKSWQLAKQLGIRIPMVPGKGYNLTTNEPLKDQPKRPVFMSERRVVATPWSTGLRLGSTIEFSGFDLSLDESRLDALKRAATDYLDIDLEEVKFTPWAGWRPMTADSLPIIKPSSKYQNLIFATGHGMQGLSLAPATGKLIVGLINKP